MKYVWAIRGDDLKTRSRQGGRSASKGFSFQDHYAALKLSELLTAEGGLVAVRYEGAQDADLMYADGRQVHVQLKDTPSKQLTWATIKPILHGFFRDHLDARAANASPPELHFKLVTSSVPIGPKISKIVRGEAAMVAKALVREAPKSIGKRATPADLVTEAEAFLARTSVEIFSGPTVANLKLMLQARLARFGIEAANAPVVTARLLTGLPDKTSFWSADVLEILRDFLPHNHPAVAKAPFYFVRMARPSNDLAAGASFRSGGQIPWSALDDELDIKRSQAGDLRAGLLAAASSQLWVLNGLAGTGKTTLARRVAHDLQTFGEMLAVDLTDSDTSEDAWQQLSSFAKAIERRVLVLLDDPNANSAAIQYVLGLERQERFVFLATMRPDPELSRQLKDGQIAVHEMRMAAITDEEVAQLPASPGVPQLSQADLQTLKDSGQIFLLAMARTAGSLGRFAVDLVEPLKAAAPTETAAYLELCLCAAFDLAVPQSFLQRRHPQVQRLETHERFKGLVFKRSARGDRIRAGHRLLAGAICQAEQINRAVLTCKMLGDVDPSLEDERQFGLRLVEICFLDGGTANALANAAAIKEAVLGFVPHAGYWDLSRIAQILENLKASAEREKVVARSSTIALQSGTDAMLFMKAAETQGTFGSAFDKLLDFYARNSTSYGRRTFMARSTHDTSVAQAQALLSMSFDWLERHSYPPAESKPILDLLNHRKDVSPYDHVPGIRGIFSLTTVTPRILFQGADLLINSLKEQPLFALLAENLDRNLDVGFLLSDDTAAPRWARALGLFNDTARRQGFAELCLQAAQQTDPKRRRNLLVAAVNAAADADLSDVRVRALAMVGNSKRDDALRNDLANMRTR